MCLKVNTPKNIWIGGLILDQNFIHPFSFRRSQYLSTKITIFPTDKTLKMTIHLFKTKMIHPSTVTISKVKLKNIESVLCASQLSRRGKHYVYYQCTKEFTRNARMLLYYVPMTTYNWINFKCPRVTIIHFYKLIWYHIQRYFCARLSVRVSNSGQPVECARKHSKNKPCHKLHQWILSGSTYHNIILHTPTILQTNKLFASACHPCKKISSETKMSHYPLLHPHTFHNPFSTSKVNPNTN